MSVPPWKAAGEQYTPVIEQIGASHNMPPDLLSRIAYQECSWRPEVIDYSTPSAAGALGMFQLEPAFFPSVLKHPGWQADALTAAQELSRLYNHFHDWEDAVAAYNWGEGEVNKWLTAGGAWSELPTETRNYLRSVFSDVDDPSAPSTDV